MALRFINPAILAEIKARNESEKMKSFLKEIMLFESEHIDKENFTYKSKIIEKIPDNPLND